MGLSERKNIRRAYGFDEVAIVPGSININPEITDTSIDIAGVNLTIPILASAMDAIVSPSFSVLMNKFGGLGVMNLEGVQTRYDDPEEVLQKISNSSQSDVTGVMQDLYKEPIKEELVSKRVNDIKKHGGYCAVSITPANTKKLSPISVEAGADILVVQSTVTTTRHISNSIKGLRFPELLDLIKVPVLVGNCVTYDVALELMETGIHGVLVGVGPGAACTTREVTGVGVPQVTATIDCAAARDEYFKRSKRYVPVITDGGIRTGGDLCKTFVSGADAVMLGTPLAQSKEAPGKGSNWGMATPDPALPRGTRVNVGVKSSLEQILFGPSSLTDGTQNLIGALKACMGMVGAQKISELHDAEMVIAPSIKTEGKYFQLSSS